MRSDQVVRVFIIGPSDTTEEAAAVSAKIQEVTRFTASFQVVFIDLNWKTSVPPGIHREGPQGLIDSTIDIEKCDIVIAIFSVRFGSPTLEAKSGTEHEIRRAIMAWERNAKPMIWIYFRDPPPTPRNLNDAKQLCALIKFRGEIQPRIITHSYTDTDDLKSSVANYLYEHAMTQLREVPPGGIHIVFSAATRLTRSEGLTEDVGDIILDITNRGLTSAAFDIDVSFSTNVSNHLMRDDLTDIVLVAVDSRFDQPTVSKPQISRARRLNDNTVTFPNAEVGIGNHVLRITNVRCAISGASASEGRIYAYVTLHSKGAGRSNIANNHSVLCVAVVQQALRFAVVGSTRFFRAADGANADIAADSIGASPERCQLGLRFSEGYPGAFTGRSGERGTTARAVSNGTRFRAAFSAIPDGVKLYVSNTNMNSSNESEPPLASLVPNANSAGGDKEVVHGIGQPQPHDQAGLSEVPNTGGYASVAWEWRGLSEPTPSTQEVIFGLLVVFSPGSAKEGTCHVNGSFAPISTSNKMEVRAPVPRFGDTSIATPLFTVI